MSVASVDVLVVGGGAVGLLVGALLGQEGYSVRVVERREDPPTRSRAIGIHPPGLDALDRVDAAAPVLTQAVRVEHGVATSRGRTLGTLSFARASPRWPFVATLEQHRTEAVLRARLRAVAPDALVVGRTVTGLEQLDDRVRVTVTSTNGGPDARTEPGADAGTSLDQDVERIDARFVVAADGARSRVRDLVGIPVRGRTYRDVYLMGDFRDPDDQEQPDHAGQDHAGQGHAGQGQTDRAAVIDVGREGVVESFPLPDGVRRFVAWTPELVRGTPSGVPGTPMLPAGAPDPVLATGLADIVAHRTGTAPDPAGATMTSAFRVHRRFATRTVADRVVLVGDAAHEISPIGGQGMNLGWLDAVALVPLLAQALRSGGAVPVGALAAFQGRQLRRARVAARQAEWNMVLGRPTSAGMLPARETLLRGALAPPVGRLLANVYAMRFA